MADDKDRRSRMAFSSVNAPAKKGGAGGKHTWGAAGDVQDYESVGAAGSKVTTAPAAAEAGEDDQRKPSANALGVKLDSESQFPALSSGAAKQQPHSNGAWDSGGPGGGLTLVQLYDLALKRSPLGTKMLSSACINAASELLSYRFTGVQGGLAALLRQCVIGSGLTGLVHRWYILIESAFADWPRDSARTVAAKTALQMTIMEPLCAAIYITAKGVLSGQRNVLATLRSTLGGIVVASWSVWGPTSLVQYRFVPVDYRTLLNNVVALFFTVYLIAKTGVPKKSS